MGMGGFEVRAGSVMDSGSFCENRDGTNEDRGWLLLKKAGRRCLVALRSWRSCF